MKRMQRLPDIFKLKGRWKQNKSEIISQSSSKRRGNLSQIAQNDVSPKVVSDLTENGSEFEQQAAHYYEYLRQLQSIKVRPGVFLTIRREDEEGSALEATALPLRREWEEEYSSPTIRRGPARLPAIKAKKALNKSYLGHRVTRSVYRSELQ